MCYRNCKYFFSMDESDFQAGEKKYHTKYSENFDGIITEENAYVEFIKNLDHSLNVDDVQESLIVYSRVFHAYCSDFLNLEILEAFIYCLIDKARKKMTKNIFNVNYFICSLCGDILRDPVTLKCGHTFSKQCVLSETKPGSFDCNKCGESYCHSYLAQLKTSVVISALIEKFWRNSSIKKDHQAAKSESLHTNCDLFSLPVISTNDKSLFTDFEAYCKSFTENPAPKDFLRKGDALVNLGKYIEATLLYLICSTFDPSAVQAKNKAIEFLHKLLLKCPRKPKSCNLPLQNSSMGQRAKENQISCDAIKNWNLIELIESREKHDLFLLMNKFCCYFDELTGENFVKDRITTPSLDKCDFECPLCMRILWEPITTPCGHTFCRTCLYRCFDHQPSCPLCKTNLINCLAERVRNTTEFIELAIISVLPDDYAERKALYIEEMEEFFNAGKDPEHVIPLFVCTIAFPTVPCPLHIFEPRYRLMIRQCMESGSRKFGMCAFIDNNISDYGTMLEIKDVRYFPDGRCVVDTVGSKRFRILSKSERDGYNTGAVEYLKDDVLADVFRQNLMELHDYVYKISQGWFMRLQPETKHQILQHFGPMPRVESNYISSPDGPSWFWWMLNALPLEPKSQILTLSMTSLPRRLRTLEKILLHLDSNMVS